MILGRWLNESNAEFGNADHGKPILTSDEWDVHIELRMGDGISLVAVPAAGSNQYANAASAIRESTVDGGSLTARRTDDPAYVGFRHENNPATWKDPANPGTCFAHRRLD